MKFTSVICLLLSATTVFAQHPVDQVKFKSKEDYARYEDQVLASSKRLLETPIDRINESNDHLGDLQFLIRWMEGTPDFTFAIDDDVVKATRSDATLLGIYLASSARFVLENRAQAADSVAVKRNALVGFLAYCENPDMHVRTTKDIRRLLKLRDENKL